MAAAGHDEVRPVGFGGVAEQPVVAKLLVLAARLPLWLRLALAALALGAVGGLGFQFLAGAASRNSPAPVALPRAVRITTTTAAPALLVVQIGGGVAQPGVYQMPEGSRLADLVVRAGGTVAEADTTRLNLAGKVADGQAFTVPRAGELSPAIDPALAGGVSGAGRQRPEDPVDLNRATAQELEALPGVGPATAAAILRYRQTNGPFAAVDDLLEVPGIGPAKLEALRGRARV